MTLSRIVMRLARNRGTEFAGGDDHRGYALTAPLSPMTATWMRRPIPSPVTPVWSAGSPPTTIPATGGWRARASAGSSTTKRIDVGEDEPLYRLGEHRFAVGEYLTITDEDGRPLTYKVVEVQPA